MSKNLIKNQAYSFNYLEYSENILNIYLVYNADDDLDISEILSYYPDKYRNNVSIYSHIDVIVDILDLEYYNTLDCYTRQQLLKLLICKKINSKYYIVLDDWIFFLKPTKYTDFFSNNNPILYYKYEPPYLNYLQNSLIFYNTNYKSYILSEKQFVTIVPFTFINVLINEMIDDLISNNKIKNVINKINKFEITEFYIYIAYIISKNYLSLYKLSLYDICIIYWKEIIYNIDDNIIINLNKNDNIKMFAIHRRGLLDINNDDTKRKIINIYEKLNIPDKLLYNFKILLNYYQYS